jgi:hypothetical protein
MTDLAEIVARSAEDELYGDSPALTAVPAVAEPGAAETIALDDAASDAGEDRASDVTLAESDLIVIGEEDEAGAADADDAGDDDDRGTTAFIPRYTAQTAC